MGKDFRNFGLIGGALALTVMSAAPAHAERVELEPTMPWNLNYGTGNCELRRTFAYEDKTAYFFMRQYEPGNSFDLFVISPDFNLRDISVRTRWEPDSKSIDDRTPLFVDSAEGGRGMVLPGTLKPASLLDEEREAYEQSEALPEPWSADERDAREAEITGFLLGGASIDDLFFHTGPLDGAMEAMRTCTDALIADWGLDPETQRHLVRQATPKDMEQWARTIGRSYPSNMASRSASAHVRVHLGISAEGAVTSCRPLNDFNRPVFDESTCKNLIEHGRYEPALDATGQPVESYDVMTVQFLAM